MSRAPIRPLAALALLALVVCGLHAGEIAGAQAGTGAVSGVVTTAGDTQEPVARAVVTLSGAELSRQRGAVTDSVGRFRIDGLPAGRFTLKVEKPGYITSMYGARRPARPGTAVAVQAGEHLANVTVRIWPGAVLSGTVRDADGRPSVGATVRAYRTSGGSTQPLPVLTNNGARTDEQGQFRIFGLEPGAYILSARSAVGQAASSALTDRRVDDLLSMLQRGQRSGLAATAGDTAPAPRSVAPTFYPGTPAVEQAQVLNVQAGAEIGGLDFTLTNVAISTVTGAVRMPDGSPAARANVRFSRWPRSTVSSLPTQAMSATTGDDGAFLLPQITPGTYKVTARWRSTRPGGGIIDPNEQPQWAATELTVGGTDLDDVVLTLGPGVRVDGRVTFEHEGADPPPPANEASITIAVEALNSGTTGMVTGVRPDGTFSLNVVPGEPLRFSVLQRGAASLWVARAAQLSSGADWLDGPVALGGATALNVVMTTRRTELSGRIRTDGGAGVPDVYVIAFATDRRYWGVETRRVQAVRPAADGAFLIKDLPPGEYFLGALVDVDNGDWLREGFLDAIAPAAVKVRITDGGKTVQDVGVGSGR